MAPFFSVVMPTRNRAHLLRYALQSVLEQTYEDFEVVVSDNSSSDSTSDVLRSVPDPRLRYVRTSAPLNMPDSWEFALSQAQGRYITYLCDDDAMGRDLLRNVAEVLRERESEIVTWTHATYFANNHPVERWRRHLAIPDCTGLQFVFQSRGSLADLFALRASPAVVPRMLNTCCSQDVVERVRHHFGRLFLPPCPDYSSCAALLACTEEYVYIDKPLSIGGAGGESAGTAGRQDRGQALTTFLEEFGRQTVLDLSPIRVMTITNMITESLLRVKRAMPDRFVDHEIDWAKYFSDCYFELTSLHAGKAVIAAELQELRRALSQRPVGFRARVWAAYLRRALPRNGLRWGGSLGGSVPFVRRFHRALQQRKTGTRIVVGEQEGFRNILECRRMLAAP